MKSIKNEGTMRSEETRMLPPTRVSEELIVRLGTTRLKLVIDVSK